MLIIILDYASHCHSTRTPLPGPALENTRAHIFSLPWLQLTVHFRVTIALHLFHNISIVANHHILIMQDNGLAANATKVNLVMTKC